MDTQLCEKLIVGNTQITPSIVNGDLHSLGEVVIDGTPLRNTAVRLLPWFDTFNGDIFRRFRFLGISRRGEETVINVKAISDPDVLFRERRDSSGDLVFRESNWDSSPLEADLRIVLAPADAAIDGRSFTGVKYWFEYESDSTPIHRLVDRQTWEVGGNLQDVNLCLRNWSHFPLTKMGKDVKFSSGGLVESFVVAFPGNLWGRWSLLPGFDMQYGKSGVLVAWFDQVSLIRTLVESMPGEDWVRCLDMHLFEQATSVRTNPKTVLYCPESLDDVDALNLWTRVYDREREKARRQFGMKDEEPPLINFHQDVWRNQDFDTSYEYMMEVAEEFDADIVFIDPVWEHGEAYDRTLRALIPEEKWQGSILEKYQYQNMCCTYDFKVAEIAGGEDGLKRLVERAAKKGLRVMSWMASHYTSRRNHTLDRKLGHGSLGIFAAKESGCHPDTGYPGECWPLNLNTPVKDRVIEQILGVCRRTGLAGFLWDSFSNLGWWQLDYGNGTMRPQFDKEAEMYATFANAGLYMQPEAFVAFSSHSCVGMAGGNYYPPGIQTGYSYDITTSFGNSDPNDPQQNDEFDILMGVKPIDMLFQWVAHRHVPSVQFYNLPREKWDPERVQEIKYLFTAYKRWRHLMQQRTVLNDCAGVLWENGSAEKLLYSFTEQTYPGALEDAVTGEKVTDGKLGKNRVYVMRG